MIQKTPCVTIASLLFVNVLLLTGCFSLKPVSDPARHFVLTPLPNPAGAGSNDTTNQLGVGIGPITLASYLDNNRLAVRRSGHEVAYSANLLWGERLSQSIPRVLGLNLAVLLGTDRIQVDSWRRQEVDFEIYVTLHQFDWTEAGVARLQAQWQVRRPGLENVSAAGFTELEGAGPSLAENPDGAVDTLNDLLQRMSRQIASKLETLAAGHH